MTRDLGFALLRIVTPVTAFPRPCWLGFRSFGLQGPHPPCFVVNAGMKRWYLVRPFSLSLFYNILFSVKSLIQLPQWRVAKDLRFGEFGDDPLCPIAQKLAYGLLLFAI